ncbi:MAG: hypothetical protein ACLSXJ_16665 [Clostridium saudiense]|uniref:hypothetical protein n=1 Tax=Clostridium saudiense TaxID=1414720 RepID=UPI0039913022
MNEIEEFLEEFIQMINHPKNINSINDRIEALILLINDSTEDLHIKSITVSESIALVWTLAERGFLCIYKNDLNKLKEMYDYLINGFFNFWQSPKYFNQDIITEYADKGLCLYLDLPLEFINTYLSTTSVALILACLGINYITDINNFESEIVMQYLEHYFQSATANSIIKIDINALSYDMM